MMDVAIGLGRQTELELELSAARQRIAELEQMRELLYAELEMARVRVGEKAFPALSTHCRAAGGARPAWSDRFVAEKDRPADSAGAGKGDVGRMTKHIVGFSGGIDSQATARYVLNREDPANVILTNSNAGGNEDELTTAFIAWYSANVHPVVMVNAIVADMWKTEGFAETKGLDGSEELTFERLIQLKGRPPSRKAQFCTEILKLRPQKRWIDQAFGPGGEFEGWDYIRYSGVRRDESAPRNKTAFEGWDQWFDCPLRHPIADWSKQMCFDYVIAHGEQVNPLYALGFNRVGCAPCINSGKEDILNWHIRRPENLDRIRRWEASTGRTFFAPTVPGLRMNNIDEVIRWAGSAHGGRQDMFPIMHERPACESKYGLCE